MPSPRCIVCNGKINEWYGFIGEVRNNCSTPYLYFCPQHKVLETSLPELFRKMWEAPIFQDRSKVVIECVVNRLKTS